MLSAPLTKMTGKPAKYALNIFPYFCPSFQAVANGPYDFLPANKLTPIKGHPKSPSGKGLSHPLSVCAPGHNNVCGLDLVTNKSVTVSRRSRFFAFWRS